MTTIATKPLSLVEPSVAKAMGCEIVRQEVSKYPGWDIATMVAISQAESNTDANSNGVLDLDERCYAQAKGDKTLTYELNHRIYGYSLGVLQVRILPGREHCDSFDVPTNVACAHRIWQEQGYSAWSVYQSGKYQQFL